MRNRRGVRKTESMKVTSLTGKAVITTELPKRTNSNGHVKPEISPRDTKLYSTSSVDGASYLPSTSEVAKNADEMPSASSASAHEKTNVSDGLPDDRPKNLHLRSASLPANVRAPHSKDSEGTTSAKTDKKARRNKSFAGVTKNSQAKKPPLEIFSLPETDVDSGITVACERSNSGRASKRNLRIMDLMKNTNDTATGSGKKQKASKAKSKEEKLRVQLPDKKTSEKRSPSFTRPGIVPPNAPYAPNYLETDLDDEQGRSRNYFVDAQRSFTVFVPNEQNKGNHNKRFTHFGSISASDEKLLQKVNESRTGRRRSSLPDLRTFFNQNEEQNTPQRNENKSARRNRTHSLNDLAKMSPLNSNQTPLHIDNLSSATEARADSPLFSPTMEQNASSNKLVQVTDL